LVLVVKFIIVGKNESVISKGQPIENYIEQNYALLVIDIQEATTGDISAYPYFRENSENFIKKNQVIDSFKMLDYPVVYVRSEITNPFINLINSSYAKGSPGVKFDRRLKVVSNLEVLKKGKDSFRNTNLDNILTSNKIN
jgi:nicotinamidase-related amidase